jgi:hypothetical protein
MSGRGTKIVVGLLGLLVIVTAAAITVAGAGSRTTPTEPSDASDDPGPDPPFRTEGSSSAFQDALALTDCVQPDDSVRISQSPASTARREIDRIARAVEQLRDLRFRRDFDVDFLSPERVAQRALRLSLEEYTPKIADIEGRMLEALGAIPRTTNLRKLTSNLIESQVAGFYVPEQGRLVVPGAPDAPLDAFDRTILAHELEHALADQNLDLPLDEVDPEAMDENTATLAVVEGDATLTMERYAVVAISAFDSLGMLGDPRLAEAQASIEEVPHYLVEQLTFPYESGLEFVCDLYARGGWDAVDSAYRRLPTTTAQVMFPDRYGDRERAIDVSSPGTPRGFASAFEGSFGAAQLLWLFEAPGDDQANALDDPEGRAAAWAGGAISVFTRQQESAVAVRVAQRRASGDMCASIAQWYDAAFTDDSTAQPHAQRALLFEGGSQTAVLSCRDDEVRLGIAAAERIAAQLAGLR